MKMSHFISSISSYDTNIMLAAVISLLVVILFVLLLHLYAKWFLTQSPTTRSSSSSSSSDHGLSVAFSTFNQHFYSYPEKGLHPSSISSIPLFVYRREDDDDDDHGGGLECVICLSFFEENETGRRLIKCGHGFHVECIDMWLHSHTNCPICRAPAMAVVSDEIAMNAKTISMEPSGHDQVPASIDIIHVGEVSIHHSDNEDDNHVIIVNHDSSSSSSSCSSSLGCSLKRMLSRTTSRSDSSKVSPSNSTNDSHLCV